MVLRDVPYNVQLAALFGVALLVFAIWKSPIFRPETVTVTPKTDAISVNNVRQNRDSDGDGLKDWEEGLLGTDPTNPDSNDNGVSDYEEVVAEYGSVTSALLGSHVQSEPTDIYASTILGTYVQSKQRDSYDEESFSYLLAQVADQQFDKRPEATTYTASDIQTRETTSEARLAYFTDLREALAPLTDIPEYEFTTFTYAVEQQDEESFVRLQQNADVYAGVIKSLRSLSVPEDAVRQHLAIINAFSRFSATLNAMSAVSSDPIEILVATRDFFEAEDAVRNAYAQLDIYFTLNNISP